LSFTKTPYVGSTLEQKKEEVVLNFDGLDCFTLVEVAMNIARQIRARVFEIEDLVAKTLKTRYRNAEIIDYTSRLHYTAEWLLENEKNGILTDITKKLGGIEHKFNFNFMSKNYRQYQALKDDKSGTLLEKIKEIESQLNHHTFYIIPRNDVIKVQRKLEDG